MKQYLLFLVILNVFLMARLDPDFEPFPAFKFRVISGTGSRKMSGSMTYINLGAYDNRPNLFRPDERIAQQTTCNGTGLTNFHSRILSFCLQHANEVFYVFIDQFTFLEVLVHCVPESEERRVVCPREVFATLDSGPSVESGLSNEAAMGAFVRRFGVHRQSNDSNVTKHWLNADYLCLDRYGRKYNSLLGLESCLLLQFGESHTTSLFVPLTTAEYVKPFVRHVSVFGSNCELSKFFANKVEGYSLNVSNSGLSCVTWLSFSHGESVEKLVQCRQYWPELDDYFQNIANDALFCGRDNYNDSFNQGDSRSLIKKYYPEYVKHEINNFCLENDDFYFSDKCTSLMTLEPRKAQDGHSIQITMTSRFASCSGNKSLTQLTLNDDNLKSEMDAKIKYAMRVYRPSYNLLPTFELCVTYMAKIAVEVAKKSAVFLADAHLFDNCQQQFDKDFKFYKTSGCYLLILDYSVQYMSMELFERMLFIDEREKFLKKDLNETVCSAVYFPSKNETIIKFSIWNNDDYWDNFNGVAHVCFIPGTYTDDLNNRSSKDAVRDLVKQLPKKKCFTSAETVAETPFYFCKVTMVSSLESEYVNRTYSDLQVASVGGNDQRDNFCSSLADLDKMLEEGGINADGQLEKFVKGCYAEPQNKDSKNRVVSCCCLAEANKTCNSKTLIEKYNDFILTTIDSSSRTCELEKVNPNCSTERVTKAFSLRCYATYSLESHELHYDIHFREDGCYTHDKALGLSGVAVQKQPEDFICDDVYAEWSKHSCFSVSLERWKDNEFVAKVVLCCRSQDFVGAKKVLLHTFDIQHFQEYHHHEDQHEHPHHGAHGHHHEHEHDEHHDHEHH